MAITDLFIRLGAPLQNHRWSWGAVTQDSQAVFLRVWAGETALIDARRCVRLTNHSRFEGSTNPGYQERLRHVESIRAGVRSYCIMCIPKNPAAHPKELLDFDGKQIVVGGDLVEWEGDSWLEMKERVFTASLLPSTS